MRFKTTTVLLLSLLLSACATTINDFQACALIPSLASNGQIIPWGGGAVCDNFLTSQPVTLSQAAWESQTMAQENSGLAIEVITSDALGNLKKEVELLCSNTKCDYKTKAAAATIAANIDRLKALGDKAKARMLK